VTTLATPFSLDDFTPKLTLAPSDDENEEEMEDDEEDEGNDEEDMEEVDDKPLKSKSKSAKGGKGEKKMTFAVDTKEASASKLRARTKKASGVGSASKDYDNLREIKKSGQVSLLANKKTNEEITEKIPKVS
jgi:hypothetical protein